MRVLIWFLILAIMSTCFTLFEYTGNPLGVGGKTIIFAIGISIALAFSKYWKKRKQRKKEEREARKGKK